MWQYSCICLFMTTTCEFTLPKDLELLRVLIRIVAAVQAFGKAGFAALKEEADNLSYAGTSVEKRRWVLMHKPFSRESRIILEQR